ncbi:MAG TPA: copper transporter [Bacillota bacterium]|nr:copper transporter [Bacillota bacterium]
MMSLRYHVVSLAAVIVALGIGILIGASVVGDRGMMKQQELLISRLDADFERLVSDRDQLLAEAEMLHRFAREATSHLLAGRLRGRAVAVVALPGAGDATGAIAQACEAAGAQVALVEFTQDALARAGPGEAEAWAGAVSSSDLARVRSLSAMGVAKVKMAEGTKYNSMVVAAAPTVSEAGIRIAQALARESDRRGIRAVLGWTCAVSNSWNADWPTNASFGAFSPGPAVGQVQGQTQAPHWPAQVYGIGRLPGNIAVVLALAGAEGVFGLPPSPVFLPENAAPAKQGAGQGSG